MNRKSTLDVPLLDQPQTSKANGSRRSKTFIDFAPDPTLILNKLGCVVTSNDAAAELLGYTKQGLREKDIESIIPGLEKKLQNGSKSFFISPKNHRIEVGSKLYGIQKNGAKFLVDVSISPIPIGNETYSWVGIRKISEPKFTEDDPRIAQAYSRSLIEAALDPLVTISPEGKITDVNEASVKATGVPREKLIGTDFSDYFTEPQKAREGYQQVFAKGFVADYPLTLVDKKGKLTDVLYNASVYKDDIGNVLGVLAAARDITQVKRTSRYARSLIEAALDPLVTINPDGKITDVNEASVRATGVPREKLIGTDFSDYFTEPQKAREGYKQVFAKGFVADYPLTLRDKKGKLTDVLYNASVYKDDMGNVLGVLAAARDITRLKQTEEKFRKIQAYTRSLIETSLDPQITKGPDGKITDVNEATVQMTGVPREKLIGTHFPDYFTEPEKAEEAYQQAFYKGIVRNYPLAIQHTSGKVTDVLYNATVFKDEDGIVQGVFASVRDITDRKQAEEELKKQQAYTRSLIEASLDPMVAISPGGKITDVNEALVKATGVVREKLIGTDFSEYFTEPDKAREGYQKVFAEGYVADLPLRLRHNKRDVLYNASVYRDEKRKVLGVFASARDITDRKQAEEEIKKQQVYTRSLIEASLDPMVAISPEGKITDVNEALVKATDVKREKLIGTDFSDYFTEPDKAREGYQKVFAEGFVADSPLRIRHNKRDVLYNASVYRDEKGNVLGAFASARDITDRKQAEEEIKKQQVYTRSLIEASLDPMVAISPEGKITDVNEALVKATDVEREKLIGTDFSDYFTEPEKAREGYQKVFAEGFVADLPLRIRHNKRDVLYNASVYRDDEKGNVLGVFASARDITDRKQVEEEIKKQQVYTRSLIEASLDPMVAISPEGKITDVNEALVKATDMEREKLIGTDFSDYFTEPEKAREGYEKVFAEGFVADLPLRIRHNKRDVLYNASVYRDEKGNVLGAFASARDITDRKQAEEEIKKQQVYTRSLIEASLDPMVAISPEGKITDVNEALVKATGVTREKLIDTDFSDYFTEPEKAREGYQQIFAKGFVADSPLRIRHNKRDVLYNASVYRDEKGNVLGAFASARDITDRKQAEEEIKKQQVYTRSLIEASLDPMVAISPEGKITDVNEALVKATGVVREKLIGTDFSDYFTEPEKAREGYQQIFAKGFVADSPLRIRHNKRDVLYNASVYRDEKGNVLGAFASARDITDRKQAEEEIKKQQVYTRSLIEASLDPMVAISPEGKITDVNEALVKATGVEREKLIDTDFSDYFTEPEKAREGYQQIFAKGFVADSPLTIRHNLRDVLYNASVYRDEKNKVLGAFASARDITAQRKQEVRINSLNEELEQRIIELESFSYSVSHDLRAPLRGIDGFIAIFLSKYFTKVDDEGQRLLGNVRRNVNKMGSLIDELLTLSRIGMKDIQITTINMDDLVHTVFEELNEIKGKSALTVKPLADARGDIALIKQVLVNLISNAFKYSNKVEDPQIEVGCSVVDGEVQYYIKDNGVGFDMEYSNKLFGVFQRLHDPQEYQGTGVGLAIVKRIIIRHGGRVWAEGKEGQGATFYFSLKSH